MNDLDSRVEEPATAKPPVEERRPDPVDDALALLDGEDVADTGDAPKVEEPQEGEKPGTLGDLAKRLGVEVSDLYDIAITQPTDANGETPTVTIGELADLAKDKGQFELDRLDFEETRGAKEREFMRARQELRELTALLPKSAVTPELLEKVATKMAATERAERVETLRVIPEWKDSSAEERERAAIKEHLAGYGFSSEYLDTIQDHKTLKYIRDNWLQSVRIQRALEKYRTRKPRTSGAGKSVGKAPMASKERGSEMRKGPKGRRQEVEAITQVLKSA